MNNNNSIEDSHENVHNSQENQVNNNEINIDIIENNNQKKPFYKQKKFIIGIIGVAVILLTVIVLVIALKGKDENSSNNDEISNSSHSKSLSNANSNIETHSNSNSNSDQSINDSSTNDEPDNIIEYKISSKYYESINNIITTYNLEQNINLANTRRLDDNSYEMKKTKTIKSKYLLNVIPQNDDLFTAYIAILSRDEVSEDVTIETFNDSEIINNDEDNNFKAVAKFDFYKNGTKKETSFLKNTQIIYQNEIEAIIPCLIPSLNSNKNKLNKTSYSLQDTVNQPIIIGDENLDLSNSEIEVVTLNQQVNSVKMNSTSKMANSEFERDDENTYLDETTTINCLIKSVETTSNQNINFLNEDGDLLAKKYEEKFKKLKFEESSSSRLRLLSNKKYADNIRLKNENEKEYKIIKNIRDLEGVEFTQSMENSFVFRHEIFKIDTLGLKLSLRADIEWVPKQSLIYFKLSYLKGTEVLEILSDYIKIENYNEVAVSYRTVIITIIKYLDEDILQKIDENYDEISELLNNQLLNYANNLDKVLDPLSKLFNESLKEKLDQFKRDIIDYSSYRYNPLFDHLYYPLEPYIKQIEDQIKNGSQSEINQLISESNLTVITLIDTQKANITNLIASVKDFINNSTISINKLNDYEKVGIDFYYRVKEIFERIDVIIDSFDDLIISSMKKELLQLEIYVNDTIYMNEMDSIFDEIEIIWDIFHNNQILNETVLNDNAIKILNKLEVLRNRYLNIKDNLLSSVNDVYETIKNNNLLSASSNIKLLKNDLKIQEETFIELIKKKVNFISNYTVYNKDIKKITEIENEISKLNISAYKANIIDKLEEFNIDSFISLSEKKNLKKK
jgi:hypothetical protein